jgi:Tfp pilus tip-associated adhesin PilY1
MAMRSRTSEAFLAIVSGILFFPLVAVGAMSDYSASPPFVLNQVHPNVLLNLSIETPMQGAAYNDQDDREDGGACGGRVSVGGGDVGPCYFPAHEYVGIFDPNKCYDYSTSDNRFNPYGAANADHSCSSRWSGNFLNWATMTAIDEFRWALTGGNRVTDTTSLTVLERGNMGLGAGDSWYPYKIIDSGYNVAPNTVTPYSDNRIYIYNHGYQLDVGTTRGGHEKAQNYYARVKVCDPTKGLESNCVSYGSYYKPEGLIQNNATRMRFALMSYSKDGDHDRHGGVLRSNMKYVGPKLADGSNNANKEYGTDGIIINNPESYSDGAGGGNSGIINYVNKFGASGYKSYDPVGELFYECLNFYKHRGPTSEYSSGLSTAEKDGFPVKTTWEDPIQYSCQQNYIIGINDANPWNDKKLPGTFFTNGTFNGVNLNDGDSGYDYGQPSNADTDINVRTLTNTVGDLEGLTGTQQCFGCSASSCDMSTTLKTVTHLGEIMGTCPYPPKENSYYIAGLAYYANTRDIRPDMDGRQTVTTFMIDTQEYNAVPLVGPMNMLYLAGKYGGFVESPTDMTDTNGDGNPYEPNLDSEWDKDGDGQPDTYVLASKPEKLVSGLAKAFSEVLKRVSSGTAASVVSNTRSGEGAVYQSLFYPALINSNCANVISQEVAWAGDVHSLLVDSHGNMREDTNHNRKLDLATDRIIIYSGKKVYKIIDVNGNGKIDFGIDKGSNNVVLTDTNGNGLLDDNELPTVYYSLADIEYLWSSAGWLNSISNVVTQRPYNTWTNDGRYLFTFIDRDGDMVGDAGETVPFATTSRADLLPFLHLFTPFAYNATSRPPGIATSTDFNSTAYSEGQADRIIKYIRGQDQAAYSFGSSIIPAMRSRQIDYNCDGTSETWRLGDDVYSTPTVAPTPLEDLDMIYQDFSYVDFARKYKNRRNVIYAGSNDGIFHAFNAGFYDSSRKKFWLNYDPTDTSDSDGDGVFKYSDVAASRLPPLGAELWGYVPFNLIPHLYWLTDPTYEHIYYCDLKPRIFDAKVFTPDTAHPNGWGTILVGGMRLGGGKIRTDKDHDGTYEPADPTSPDQELKSAYFILDITDPESPPQVLAEVTFNDLGFTTSNPTVIAMDPQDTVNANKWYLVLGSGPISSDATYTTAVKNVTSNQEARIYLIDLKALAQSHLLRNQAGSALPAAGAFATMTGDSNSYVSDLITVDFNLNYKADAVYFGTTSGSEGNWGGKMRRIVINDDTDTSHWDGDSVVFNAQRPITGAASVGQDNTGRFWVFFGTGRFMTRNDITYVASQSFFGVKEPIAVPASGDPLDRTALTWTEVAAASLLDVSNAIVYDGGGRVDNVTGVTNFQQLRNKLVDGATLSEKSGWKLTFSHAGERNLGQATLLGGILTFTTYTPDADPCEFEGTSSIFATNYLTGSAYKSSVIGFGGRTATINGQTKYEVLREKSLGDGMTTTPNVHTGDEGGSVVYVQMSTGEIKTLFEVNPGMVHSEKTYWQEWLDQ